MIMDFPDIFGASLTNLITAYKFHELMQGNDHGVVVKCKEGSKQLYKEVQGNYCWVREKHRTGLIEQSTPLQMFEAI